MVDREQMIADSLEVKDLLTDTTELDADIERLQRELDEISSQVSALVNENAQSAQDQQAYAERYDKLSQKYEATRLAYNKVIETRNYRQAQALQLDAFISVIKKADIILSEWSMDIWNVLVESGTVHRNLTITFKFKNGKKITVPLSE